MACKRSRVRVPLSPPYFLSGIARDKIWLRGGAKRSGAIQVSPKLIKGSIMSYESPEVTAHNVKMVRGWNMRMVLQRANPNVSLEAAVAEMPEAIAIPEEQKSESYASDEIVDAA
jgi:hypothetical protein